MVYDGGGGSGGGGGGGSGGGSGGGCSSSGGGSWGRLKTTLPFDRWEQAKKENLGPPPSR